MAFDEQRNYVCGMDKPYFPQRGPCNLPALVIHVTQPFSLPQGTQFPSVEAKQPMIYSLLIINKAGGLIYNREYNEGISRLSSNDYLVLAGTFHGYCTPFDPHILFQRLVC
jgi:Sybindin-like family